MPVVACCVADAMIREVVTVGADEKVSAAIEMMADRSISSLLVTREEKLLGIITEKDIVSRVVKVRLDPSKIDIAEIMSTSLITVEPETTITEANRLMVEKRIKKLPVITPKDKRLVGILSLTDLAKLHPRIYENTTPRDKSSSEEALMVAILGSEESQTLEFKSTLRWDLEKRCVNTAIEKAIMKSICAFMNSDGGQLVIGVSDKRAVIGLGADYRTLSNQNRDGFENRLTTLISNMIGAPFLQNIKVSFPTLGDKEVCLAKILPTREPVYLHDAGQEVFFVRTGNSSRPFSLSDTVRYVKDRWK